MPRVPPHFKVRLTAQNHVKLREVWPDNDRLALWIRLGVKAVERNADKTGDAFIVHESELPALAGKGRRDSAEKLLRYLVDTSPVVAKKTGTSWLVTLPNLAQKQGFKVKKGRRKAPPTTTTTTTPTDPPQDPLLPTVSDRGPTEAPDRLNAGEGKAVRRWASEKFPDLGEFQIREQIEACLDHFRASGKRKKNWVATCRNWIRNNHKGGKSDGRGRGSRLDGAAERAIARLRGS